MILNYAIKLQCSFTNFFKGFNEHLKLRISTLFQIKVPLPKNIITNYVDETKIILVCSGLIILFWTFATHFVLRFRSAYSLCSLSGFVSGRLFRRFVCMCFFGHLWTYFRYNFQNIRFLNIPHIIQI